MRKITKNVFLTISILISSLSMNAAEKTKNMTDSLNQFSFDFFNTLSDKNKNIFFSPLSLHMALASVAMGAEGQTYQEFADHVKIDKNTLSNYEAFLKDLKQPSNSPLVIANKLWTKKNKNFLPQFIADSKKYFFSTPESLDFVEQTEASRKTINQWVESNTRKKIKELLPGGTLTPLTEFVITNTVYFKGQWKKQFEISQTKNDSFHLTDGSSVQTPFMSLYDNFNYSENKNYQVLELMYKEDLYSLVVFLPKDKQSHLNLDLQQYNELLQSLKTQQLEIFLPKIKMDYKIEANNELIKMGVNRAFQPAEARFTKMSPYDPKNNIFISKVIHKSVLEINEEGTEAAAATAVTGFGAGAPPKYKIFKADKPFLLFLLKKPSHEIIFMGQYAGRS